MKANVFSVLLVCWSVIACGPSAAEVADSEPGGFTTINETTIDESRAAVWHAAIQDIDQWWSPDHTISGEASRLSITAKLQGCFCERLGNDTGVVHMDVTMVSPEVVLRLSGGLGPLGLMGVNGNMTWEFEDDDDRTRVKFTYAVGGYRPGGLDGIANPVDGVIGEALLRLKAYIEKGDANQIDTQ